MFNAPTYSLLGIALAFVQFIAIPLLIYIAKMVRRTYRQNRLQDIKHEALVHTIQKKLSGNGFSEYYYQAVNQLMKEHNFINKD